MHIPIYPLKGGNLTVEEFTAQLSAIRDSLPDRITPLSAMADVQELVGGQDMPVLKKKPELAKPLLSLVNDIIKAHETKHDFVGGLQGLEDLQRMGAAQNLRAQLVRAGRHLSLHENHGPKLHIAPHTRKTWASKNKTGLRIVREEDDTQPSLRVYNPDDDAPDRQR
ncbi:MAG: hypothetical protein EBV03_13600 [Proteobacteria bacterium]|nr:hypothetical protein [Pseudomonadota bacterium]